MQISRNFMVIGVVYLLLGITFGIYMSGSGDHEFTPLHAHINLLGFTLMTVFGVVYRVVPDMAGNRLAQAHFWLHQAGALGLLVMLWLLLSGRIGEAGMVPVAPIAELLVLLGILAFAVNLWRNA